MPCKLTVIRPSDFVEFRKEAIQQGIHDRFEGQVRLYPGNIARKARPTSSRGGMSTTGSAFRFTKSRQTPIPQSHPTGWCWAQGRA
jgi:hypothetical protein